MHQFHYECLSIWVNRKNNCPLCNSSEFNPIEVKCRMCYDKYILTNIEKNNTLFKEISNKQGICNNCERTDDTKKLRKN